MLEAIMERQIIFYILGGIAALGIIAKLISGISLKRLVKAAGNMSKSTHPLMRLIRAKFEHACMVSDRVQNISAFVDKYMYEYKVCGIRLHSWRQLQKRMIWFCGILSVLGMMIEYYYQGMWFQFYNYALVGGIATGFLLLLYLSTDEKYQMSVAKTYMVDFLENTYAHRYEKNQQKGIQVTVQRAEMDEGSPLVRDERVEEPKEQPKSQIHRVMEKHVDGSEERMDLEEKDRENKKEKGSREIREIRESRGIREDREVRESRGVREDREIEENRENREARENREVREAREEREDREGKYMRGKRSLHIRRGVPSQESVQELKTPMEEMVDEHREEGMKEAKIREILEEFLA